jgi:hypothetical protein
MKATRSKRNSSSHWRQAPQGDAVIPIASKSPGLAPPTTAHAIAQRSAQSPIGYDAFSTFTPVTTRPSRRSAAAPTKNSEYGA